MSGTSIPLAGVQPNILGDWQAGANIANTQQNALRTAAQVPLIQQQTQGAAINNELAKIGLGYQRWWYGMMRSQLGGQGQGQAPSAPPPNALASVGSAGAGATGTGAPVQSAALGPPGQGAAPSPAANLPWGGMDIGGFSVPATPAILALRDPAKAPAALKTLFDERQQQLTTFAAQATDPASWNAGIARLVQQGWMSPQRAAQWFGNFGARDRFVAGLAPAAAQIAYQGALFGHGAKMGPGGAPVPSPAAADSQYSLASGKGAGANLPINPNSATSLSPLAAAIRNGGGAPAAAAPGAPIIATHGPVPFTQYAADVQKMEGGGPGVQGPAGSTASGPYQINAATWQQYGGGLPASAAGDAATALPVLQRITQANAQALSTAGLPVNGTTLGLAHTLGPSGVLPVLNAVMRAPTTPIGQIMPASVIQANGWNAAEPVQDFVGKYVSTYGLRPVELSGQAPGAAAAGAPSATPSAAPPGAPGIPGFTDLGKPIGAGPTAAVTPTPGGGETIGSTLTPAGVSMQQGQVGQFIKFQGEQQTAASTAVQANAVMDQMKTEMQSWTPGVFADPSEQALRALDGIIQPLTGYQIKSVGDWQAFNKNSMQVVSSAVRAISSRAAVQEFNLMRKALPSSEMTPQGLGQIFDELQGLSDFTIAKAAGAARFQGTESQFNAGWNQAVSPIPFILHRMSVPDFTALRNSMAKTPQGRATWATLMGQVASLDRAGVFNSLPGAQ